MLIKKKLMENVNVYLDILEILIIFVKEKYVN